MEHYIGIDIGSTCAKTIVLDGENNILHRILQPTGWSSVVTAQSIFDELSSRGISPEDAHTVATGYGRISVPYAERSVTEISCHAKGACFLYGSKDLTLIDIGGQDTKIISIENGMVKDFVMNDKCSAGTGRFLEVMANTLALRPEALCALAEKGSGTMISAMCTVFAEGEVTGLIGRGESKENIAFAVVDSIVRKVASQAGRLKLSDQVCLTGGLCGFEYLRRRLGEELGADVRVHDDGRYAGALGAALYAAKKEKLR